VGIGGSRSPENDLTTQAVLSNVTAHYVYWRGDAQAVQDAYDSWTACDGSDSDLEYAQYLAVLDAEENSAGVLADRVGWARHLLT
jgi:outer membrane protein assembly factor BamD (BamD/ComL family)